MRLSWWHTDAIRAMTAGSGLPQVGYAKVVFLSLGIVKCLGPILLSVCALSGRLEFTVRRHKSRVKIVSRQSLLNFYDVKTISSQLLDKLYSTFNVVLVVAGVCAGCAAAGGLSPHDA